MARIKNISGDNRSVPALGGRVVWAGQVVEVPDEDAFGYVCQTSIWAPADNNGEVDQDGVAAVEVLLEAQNQAIAAATAALYEPVPIEGLTPEAPDVDLSALTKAELVEHATSLGVDTSGAGTKAEIIAAISGTNDDPATGGQEG